MKWVFSNFLTSFVSSPEMKGSYSFVLELNRAAHPNPWILHFFRKGFWLIFGIRETEKTSHARM